MAEDKFNCRKSKKYKDVWPGSVHESELRSQNHPGTGTD